MGFEVVTALRAVGRFTSFCIVVGSGFGLGFGAGRRGVGAGLDLWAGFVLVENPLQVVGVHHLHFEQIFDHVLQHFAASRENLVGGFGGLVDRAFNPFLYMFDTQPVNLALGGAEGIVQREAFLEPLDDLRANSIDFYSALRGAYFQNRDTELRRGAEADSAMFDDAFAAFE